MLQKLWHYINKALVWVMIIPVKIYKYTISPLLPKSCRHVPTCSEYAIEALKVHGPLRGAYLAIWRILRCNPWGTHGYDPVPPPKGKKINDAKEH